MRLAAEHVLDKRANFRNASRTADQDDFIDLLRFETGIFEGLFARTNSAIDDRLDQLLELFAADLALVAPTLRQFDIEFYRGLRRQRNLRINNGFADRGYGFTIS